MDFINVVQFYHCGCTNTSNIIIINTHTSRAPDSETKIYKYVEILDFLWRFTMDGDILTQTFWHTCTEDVSINMTIYYMHDFNHLSILEFGLMIGINDLFGNTENHELWCSHYNNNCKNEIRQYLLQIFWNNNFYFLIHLKCFHLPDKS